tara:strand:- start:314 stop:1741 length:1428 start_codon:yes stop_codon:yes gene_type:complete
MKNLSIISYKYFYYLLFSCVVCQEPFLEIRPFLKPSFEQYPASNHVDHHHPYSNQADNLFLRFDGTEYVDDVIYPDCLTGSSCYDGHAGIDYFMPLNTPILAPANGYVLWSSFSSPADPCPGGITPNGDQGTIILAHGNDYFTVYLHMMPPLNVNVGENVLTGDTLGFTGNTGCAINSHLHFEIRKGNWFFDSSEPYAVDPFGWWHNSIDPIEQFRDNRSDWLWISDNLVDDGDNGFQRFQGPEWNYLTSGYDNDSWISPTVISQENSQHYAIWVPYLEHDGEYDVEVFIPTGLNATTEAIYEVNIKNEYGISEKNIVVFNQNINQGNFNTITTMYLPAGSKCSIILRDIVGPSSSGSFVVYDAIRFTSVTSSTNLNDRPIKAENILINSIYPNPFNAQAKIIYQTFSNKNFTISIYDKLGNKIIQKTKQNHPKGFHTFYWDGQNNHGEIVSSGIYFFSIHSTEERKTKKLVYLK